MELNPEDLIKLFTLQNWQNREKAMKNLMKYRKMMEEFYKAAMENKLSNWKRSLKGKLALILIYDQIPRFIFNDKRMYETDEIAREIAKNLYKTKEYEKLSEIEQMFAFLPLHHSENLEDQKIANKIFKRLYENDPKEFGWIYKASNGYIKIIKTFGRFPHRDKILGRRSDKNKIT